MTGALLLAALLAAPFTAEQPRVREGNERLLAGDGQAALERYDAAEREVGPHPEIDYDRGNALLSLGRPAEARDAWQRALERDRTGALSSRALQNMGNALDALGDRDGAVKALSRALTRDPSNEDARYNLEVLLRRQASGKGQPKEEGEQGPRKQAEASKGSGSQPQPSQGQPGGAPQPAPGPGQPPSGQGQPGRPPAERTEGKDAGQAGAKGERQGERADQAEARREGFRRQDAERLLDALRARERQMPLAPAGRRETRRKDVEKDW